MIFTYTSYKKYLTDIFNLKENRGSRRKVAEYLGCQPGYISQVLNGDTVHFSLEHIEQIGGFLKLNKDEKSYLILLGQYEKAGSINLQTIFLEQIKRMQEIFGSIKERIDERGKVLTEKEMAIYYSHWSYMAVHMIISLKSFQTRNTIRKHFNFSSEFNNNVINFLINTGFINEKGNKLSIGETRIHLEEQSPFISSLHQNWRNKAIQSLQNNSEINLHYSSVLVLSKKDIFKIKQLILDFIKKKEEILRPSPEEEIIALNIDYFEL